MVQKRNRPEQRTGPLRCAIYTRKSTEEGLDQEFNSLDAQREACEAYIVSQRHEGWQLLPDQYDDGGLSGGTMERPALKRLLEDVRSGKVDVIVVYKVDRLTRALSDFAKIVDILDGAEASFVSITQAFNTTTSMGRLTLNVLLSFAQFEREVISERVRDKVAASKAKGMWMGGSVALGYRVEARKLLVDEEEAATVRHIFQRYLEVGNVPALLEELRATGVVTKRQVRRDGSSRGGISFERGAIYHLLKNRIYRGEVVHHGRYYPGEHEAIVPEPLFEAVQLQLASNIGARRSGKRFVSPSLLAGMIRDEADRPLSPSHALKAGKRYRYYVSNKAGDEQGATAIRLPAKMLDKSVLAALIRCITNTSALLNGASNVSAQEISHLTVDLQHLATRLRESRTTVLRPLLLSLDLRIEVHSERITASCCKLGLLKAIGLQANWDFNSPRLDFDVPATVQRRGHELRLRLDPPDQASARDPKLIGLIVRAFAARDQLEAMEPDAPRNLRRELSRVARASYLAPDIVTAILEGRQPTTLRSRKVERGELPLCWNAQRQLLGFSQQL